MDSVYASESGEWKLAGFEVLSSVADDDPFIYVRLMNRTTVGAGLIKGRGMGGYYQTRTGTARRR
jgi:hypothetical protein